MEKQKENPKSMNSSSKREKVGFNVGGAGGIVVIGATVVAAAIGAAFLAYRDKRCSNKQGADRTSENGIDEKTEKDLLDLGKLEGFSETLVIRESVNQKNETTEDNSDHEDEEKIEVALEETGDSSPESNMEAMRLSEMIDHKKSSNKEELAFGSLIEIQETNPSIGKKESKRKSSYDGSTIDIETAKETVEASTVDIENNPSYDFSFWNNDLNKHKEIEEIIKEASEKSEERPYDVFELEDEQRNGNTFVFTSEKSESGNYEQIVENMQVEKEIGGEKGGAFVYAGVEVEQNGKGDGKLFEEEETNKVNDTANVVDGKDNGKGEDTQSALKETDEKDDGEEEQSSIIYVEVEEKVAEKEGEIFTHKEQRKGDDKGNTESDDDDKEKGDDISYAELVEDEEANKVNDTTNYENVKEKEKGEATQRALKETDEKDECKEVQGDITHVEVEGKQTEKEEKIAHDEERKGDGSGNAEAEEDGKDNIILKETADSVTVVHVKEMEKDVEQNRIDVVNIRTDENLGVYICGKLAGQDKVGDVTLIDVSEENSQKDIDYIQETDNKVREDEEEEEHDDNTNRQDEEMAVKEEERDEIRHVEEEEIVMETDNQDKCRDNTEVEIKVVEKEENKREKGVDDDVDSSEENEKRKGEYIVIRDELHEDVKSVKVMENEEKREENDEKLLLLEKREDADNIPTPIEVGEAESKNEEGNEINLTEQGAFNTKNGVDLEIEKNKERAESACVEIEVEEQNTEGGIAYTEVGKGNKANDTYNAVHGQQNLKEEDDDGEIIRKEEIVEKEVVSKAMIEDNVEKIGVVKERLHEISKEDIRAENKDNMLKEMENDVKQHGVEASRDISMSDEVNKELSHITQEEGIKVNGEEGKEPDDITLAEAVVFKARKEHEDTPHVEEGRNAIENEKEDTYRDDSSINVEVKSAEVNGIANIKNNLEQEEKKEDETANKDFNAVESEEAKKEDATEEEEIKTEEEMQNKNYEEKFNNMNKEVESESFAAFQNDDNVDKEDEESEDDNENGMKQQFADHSLIKNSNTGEDAECLVLAKTKKTTNMFMDHISKGLFLLVLAMSIVVVILSILAQQDHLYYYYDHHLPHFCREIFQIFSASINQTAEIQ